MIQLSSHPKGVVVPVRAQPRARQNRVVGTHAGSLKIAVTEPPEDGKANHAIMRVLADLLGLKRSEIQLLSGAASRDKRFLLIGRRAGEIHAKLMGSGLQISNLPITKEETSIHCRANLKTVNPTPSSGVE